MKNEKLYVESVNMFVVVSWADLQILSVCVCVGGGGGGGGGVGILLQTLDYAVPILRN